MSRKHNQLIKWSDFCHSVVNQNKIFRPSLSSELYFYFVLLIVAKGTLMSAPTIFHYLKSN
jgi:hypothetical protein